LSSTPEGLASLAKVEAILANPAIYELAELIPEPDRTQGGRPRDYPVWTLLFWEALLSVFGSARQVEAELSHRLVWQMCRRTVRRRFPDRPDMRLPSRPMRRHHYLYGRNTLLSGPAVLDAIAERHREIAAEQARELGLLDPDGPGSWTHPDLSRMLHADGKVITPLFKAKPDDTVVDRRTGEIRSPRTEPDAGLHWEGTGEAAWGSKFVIVATRSTHTRGRIILYTPWVPEVGAEAATAMRLFEHLAPLCEGAQGVIYDTARRGVHHQQLLRHLGWLSVNKVTAKHAGSGEARRDAAEHRVPKNVHLDTRTIKRGDEIHTVDLYARNGTVGIARMLDNGHLEFVPLRRVRTHRNQDRNGRYRWYNDHELPDWVGGGTITVRLHQNDSDTRRGLNRTENVRPIPPDDPDFKNLYARRNDAESINRHLEDTLWLNRAHSIGHARQHLSLIGYAICVNAIAVAEHHHRRRRTEPAAA
jgi:hypothetical protein